MEYGVAMPFTADGGARNPVNSTTMDWSRAVGATAIRIAEWFSPDLQTSVVGRLEGWSHTNESLTDIGLTAAQMGLEVTYSLYITDRDGRNIGFAPPLADPAAFFSSYTAVLREQAALAEAMGATCFVIGHEMGVITSLYRDQWLAAIAAVREEFSGAVTYAANCNTGPWYQHADTAFSGENEARTLSFGDALDFIGIDLYLPGPVEPTSRAGQAQVWSTGSVSVQDILADWDNVQAYGYSHVDVVRDIAQQWGKQVLILETGFTTHAFGVSQDAAERGEPDQLAQANQWEAALRLLNFYVPDVVAGLFHHFEFEWAAEQEWYYSVRGKLAENVLNRWFTGEARSQDYEIALSTTLTRAFGLDGNDTFTAGAGSHVVDGGLGIDTAVFAQALADCEVTRVGSQWHVSAGSARDDHLSSVERLRFDDISLALDLDGQAGDVARILGAVFGIDPRDNAAFVGVGLDYADAGLGVSQLMELALAARLGTSPSNAEVVDLLYRNVTGQAPSAAELAHYVAMLDTHAQTPVSIGLLAAESAFNLARIDFAALSATGLAFV